MSLFEVPGWSIPSPALVAEQSNRTSKKRKRPTNDNNKSNTVEVNMDKIMAELSKTLSEGTSEDGAGRTTTSKFLHAQRRQKKQKQRNTSAPVQPQEDSPSAKKEKLQVKPEKTPRKSYNDDTYDAASTKLKKKGKQNPHESPTVKPKSLSARKKSSASTALTSLQQSMKDKLDGARFRLINENIYKSDGHSAHQMMKEDPNVFEEYHIGFRHQVLSWPINPVEHYISHFASYPSSTIIADLGCGDAALAKGLLPKGLPVISFDLVSDRQYVVEADICDKIPLPGSEPTADQKASGEGQVVDVVVCALSLMGVNWVNCIREAWRILKAGGELHIAEVTSRFSDIEQFQSLLGTLGFRLKTKDDITSTHFVLLEFTKVARKSRNEKEWSKLLAKGSILKPCEYKRR